MCVAAVVVAAEGERELGWGRVRMFLHRLGKTIDHRSLSLAHCDLTATDLLELGDYPRCVQSHCPHNFADFS